MQSRMLMLFVILWNCWILDAFGFFRIPPLLQQIDDKDVRDTTIGECLYGCADQVEFNECMRNCSSEWIFRNESACCAKLGCEETKNTSEVACNPSSIQQNELRKRLPSGEIRSFLYMKWEPCLAAIDNLDGYLIKSEIRFNRKSSKCFNTRLVRSLSGDIDRDLQFVFLIPLVYNKIYIVEIHAYPYLDTDPQSTSNVLTFLTPTCHALNGPRSCFCDTDTLPAPAAIQEGYGIKVSFFPSHACFNVTEYRIQIYSEDSKVISHSALIEPPKGNQSRITHLFNDPKIYDSRYTMNIRVRSMYGQKQVDSNISQVTIKAWSQPTPEVFRLNDGGVRVFFDLKSKYIISDVQIRLSNVSGQDGSSDTLKTDSVKVTEGNVTNDYYLPPGLYGVEIREVRNAPDFFNSAEWGPLHTFFVESDENRKAPINDGEKTALSIGSTIIIAFVVIVVLILVVSILFCYFGRKGQIALLNQKANLFPLISRKRIRIIWQEDDRSDNLKNLKKKVITSFAKFLQSLGMDASVDVLEKSDLRDTAKQVDRIVFVSPHFDPGTDDIRKSFNREIELLSTEGFKYKLVSVFFSYSSCDADSHHSAAAEFNLMNDIDDLCFHLQGLSEANSFKRWLFRIFHRHNSSQSSLREALMEAVREMSDKIDLYESQCKGIIRPIDGDVSVAPTPPGSPRDSHCLQDDDIMCVDLHSRSESVHPQIQLIVPNRSAFTAPPTTCPTFNDPRNVDAGSVDQATDSEFFDSQVSDWSQRKIRPDQCNPDSNSAVGRISDFFQREIVAFSFGPQSSRKSSFCPSDSSPIGPNAYPFSQNELIATPVEDVPRNMLETSGAVHTSSPAVYRACHFSGAHADTLQSNQQSKYEHSLDNAQRDTFGRVANSMLPTSAVRIPDSLATSCDESLNMDDHHCHLHYPFEHSCMHVRAFGEECPRCENETPPKLPIEPSQHPQPEEDDFSSHLMMEAPDFPVDSGVDTLPESYDSSRRSSNA